MAKSLLMAFAWASVLLLPMDARQVAGEPRPPRIWGVTVDRIEPSAAIVDAVLALPKRMTVRVVLDNGLPPTSYGPLIQRLAPRADVMVELADSYDMKSLRPSDLEAKTAGALAAFGSQVAIWEIGNEVNGNWLGPVSEVASKVVQTYDQVKAKGGKAAITLYYCEGPEGLSPEAFMVKWSLEHLPPRMLQGLDFVFVSYYQNDNPALPTPDWPQVFTRLGQTFPNSRLGFGEVGLGKSGNPEEAIRHYYGMKVAHPRFVGGYFWWTFATDMVPKKKKLWRVLKAELASAP